MDLKFKHLGVAVPDLAQTLPVYRDLFGYQVSSGPFDDPVQQVSVCFLSGGVTGQVEIELVAPLGESSPVRRTLKNGGGAYHLCYETRDLQLSIVQLLEKGCVMVHEPVQAVAFEGRHIAWIFTPTRNLLELVERS